MQWPFVSRALYRNVLRQLAVERQRASDLSAELAQERRDNRSAERHWANQFLRKLNSYPMAAPEKEKIGTPAPSLEPRPIPYDAGELKALVDEAARLGLSEDDARNFFMREKDIDVLM